MIHAAILLCCRDHRQPSSWVIRVLDFAEELSSLRTDRNDGKRGIPIVDRDQVLLRAVNGEVARTCAPSVNLPNRVQSAIRRYPVS